jgi:hypothetical protein
MGNSFDRSVSLRKNAADAMGRLTTLEGELEDVKGSLPRLAMGVQNITNKLSQDLYEVREYIDALIGLVGPEEVQKVIMDNRLTKSHADADASKANIAKKVEEGALAKAEKVTEESLVVGHEVKADGTVVEPGFASFAFSQVHPEFKTKLLGQSPGAVVELKDGHTFKVEEVYVEVPKAPVTAPTLEAVPNTTQAGA